MKKKKMVLFLSRGTVTATFLENAIYETAFNAQRDGTGIFGIHQCNAIIMIKSSGVDDVGSERMNERKRKRGRRGEGRNSRGVEIHGKAVAGGRDPFSPAYCMPYAASLPH